MQDGFVLSLVAIALRRLGLSNAAAVPGDSPYLRAARRLLSQAGWNPDAPETGAMEAYCAAGGYLIDNLPFVDRIRNKDDEFLRSCPDPAPLPEPVSTHLKGVLAVPLLSALWECGRLDGPAFADGLPNVALFLERQGWISRGSGLWTPAGIVAKTHAKYFGMVCSYIPLLTRLDQLISGDSSVGRPRDGHVDRRLNIVASAAAHRQYFHDADEPVLDIFNREPVDAQPVFVMDTGCGDGSWLVHIYNIIRSRTLRGRMLDRYPLAMVGADYNKVCEEICLRNLREAGVPGFFIQGDITEPAGLSDALREHRLEMEEGLHIRSFIDHNRRFTGEFTEVNGAQGPMPTGVYIAPNHSEIPASIVRADLTGFLRRWEPYARRHGLLILEAHCVEPAIAAQFLGDTHNLVFDTYHAFSHQYPVDFPVFMDAASEAGLRPVIEHQRRYPSRKPFVAVSSNLFRSREARVAQPSLQQNDDDGEHLHRLLYLEGDLNFPRTWASGATGELLRPVLWEIRRLLNEIEEGLVPPQAIEVADYGSGTGMAAIELLRALRENGALAKCERLGVRFRLHLLDIPSPWFDKARELLRDCELAEFHDIRGESGFLPLPQVVGKERGMNIVMASMVFHLIPVKALPRVAAELASILVPGGCLFWNSPDIGPADRGSVLFHDPNRTLRRTLLALLADPGKVAETGWAARHPAEAAAFVNHIRRLAITPERLAAAARAADAQILPEANQAAGIHDVLSRVLGAGEFHTRSYEMCLEEAVDTLLVPANRRFLGEIEDPGMRESLVRGLMACDIVPGLRSSVARTHSGYSVHWTFGQYRRSGGAQGRDAVFG